MVLLDTSVAVPFVREVDPDHVHVRSALAGHRLGLAGHAEFETYSLLTRIPPPHRVDATTASVVLDHEFPETRHLSEAAARGLRAEFVSLGVDGGAVFDGLVGAAARAHGLTLVTKDRRAERVYQALGVRYLML